MPTTTPVLFLHERIALLTEQVAELTTQVAALTAKLHHVSAVHATALDSAHEKLDELLRNTHPQRGTIYGY